MRRCSQEGFFAELKSQNQLGYVPMRFWHGNQVYLLSAVLTHNLSRELQMAAYAPSRALREKRLHCGQLNNWMRSGDGLSNGLGG